MRVLFVHQGIEGTIGEAVESREIIKSLLGQDCQVSVLYIGNISPELPDIHLADLQCVTWSKRKDKDHIRQLITQSCPDIAHIKCLWTPFHARTASVLRQLHIPYIVEPGGHLNPYLRNHRFGGKKMTLYHKLMRLIYHRFIDLPLCRKAEGIRTLSPWEASSIRPLVHNLVETIPLGFNSEWVTSVRLESPFPTTSSQPLRVNFLGRLDISQKGLDLVLSAMSEIQKKGFSHRFQVRLSGPSLQDSSHRLQEIIKHLGLNNTIVEKGCFGEDKLAFFRSTDVFLHMSRLEETAKLAREATGAGIPVMASFESNYGDWLLKENSGVTADLTPHSIAHQLMDLSEHPERLHRMSINAVKHATKHSWHSLATQLISFYERIL